MTFLQHDPKEFAAGDYNLYRYCHNDPVNKSDPFGLDTAIAIGAIRDDWTGVPNPFGHASMAMTGQGTFSAGTGTTAGSSFTAFLGEQAGHRGTTVYILHTTPQQEAAMKKSFEAAAAKNALPNVLRHPGDAYKDNCATRVSDALKAGGQDVGNSHTPGQLQHQLEQKVNNGEATRVPIFQNSKPEIPPILKKFDKTP